MRPAPAFFVVGVPRSGTTLVRCMLDSHPRVAVPPETHFLPWLFAAEEPWPELAPALPDRLRRYAGYRALGLDADDLAACIDEADGLASFVSALYRRYGAHRGKSIVGDKTPRYAQHWHLLAKHFPHAPFVHVVRDPARAVLSWVDARFGPKTVDEAGRKWQMIVQDMDRARAAGRQVVDVRYESLLEAPQAVLEPVCGAIGVDFDEAMLAFEGAATEYMRSEPHPEAHQRLLSGLEQSEQPDDRVLAVRRELALVPGVAELAERHGYAV